MPVDLGHVHPPESPVVNMTTKHKAATALSTIIGTTVLRPEQSQISLYGSLETHWIKIPIMGYYVSVLLLQAIRIHG